MKIQKGIVKYKDRSDIVCSYGTTDDNVNYYFLDIGYDYKLPNGNLIASTELVEAIDPMFHASHVGVIDENGKIVVPFNHRSIRLINNDLLLVELAEPVSTSVLEANEMKNNPALATKLVSTPALIKERLNSKMNGKGKYLFNDQFADASICDLDGNNLVNGEYYSFIAEDGGKLYFSKNTVDSDIAEYSTLPAEVQEDVAEESPKEIDVSSIEVPTEIVEKALEENKAKEETSEKEEKVSTEEDKKEEMSEEKLSIGVEASEVIEPGELEEESSSGELEEESSLEEPEEEPSEEDEAVSEATLKISLDDEEDLPETNLEDDIVHVDEIVEDTALDDMIHISHESSEEEDPLKDFAVETDFIDKEDYDSQFAMPPYESDSIVSDVAKYMDSLMKQNQNLNSQNQELVEQNDTLNTTLEKVMASRASVVEKANAQEKRIDTLNSKVQDLEKNISELEKVNREQERIISSQTQDRADLEKVLANVREVLGENV